MINVIDAAHQKVDFSNDTFDVVFKDMKVETLNC